VTLGEEAQDNPFRFDGFYHDSGVKTYDMHARHYRPEIGRFLTQDHYASASADLLLQADPLTQNRYAFAGANPVTYIEFDGHDPATSYDRNASQPMKTKDGKTIRDPTPAEDRRRSNDGPDVFYQRGPDEENDEQLTNYNSGPGRASDFQGQQRWHETPTEYACQACPSPATLAKRREHARERSFLAGAKTVVSQTAEAVMNPRQTVEGVWWSLNNPQQAVQAILDTCDGRTIEWCAGYITTSLAGAKGAQATVGTALRRGGDVRRNWQWRGGELERLDRSARIAPFGNPRTQTMIDEGERNPWFRRLPHYHRRRLGPDGNTLEGQGIGRHRPWEGKPSDRRRLSRDRF